MSSDDDYLTRGKVNTPSILSNSRNDVNTLLTKQPSNSDLFLEGYGRQWGEKTTYSVGLCYGMGLGVGGFYGSLLGIQKGGKTPKLFLNSVMNGASARGPALANQSAILTMFYVLSNQFIGWVRGEDDLFNAPMAGGFSGFLYKCTSGPGWTPALKYSTAGAVVFSGIDQMVRRGYI